MGENIFLNIDVMKKTETSYNIFVPISLPTLNEQSFLQKCKLTTHLLEDWSSY